MTKLWPASGNCILSLCKSNHAQWPFWSTLLQEGKTHFYQQWLEKIQIFKFHPKKKRRKKKVSFSQNFFFFCLFQSIPLNRSFLLCTHFPMYYFFHSLPFSIHICSKQKEDIY